MGADMSFFSNLDDGFFNIQENTAEVIPPQESIRYCGEVFIPKTGIYYAQFACSNWLEIRLNGVLCNWAQSLKLTGRWRELKITFDKGTCLLQTELKNLNSIPVSGGFKMRLLDHNGNLIYPEMQLPLPENFPEYREESMKVNLDGFRAGIGASIRSGGRFGYTKGDGVLDYSMPGFGVLAKPYLSGHPEFKSGILWHFSLLPPGEENSCSLIRSYSPGPEESISSDWTGVYWQKTLKDGGFLKFHYSLLTPALLMESNLSVLYLNGLAHACRYQSIMLPVKSGQVTVRRQCNGLFYDRKRDGLLHSNWILLFGGDSFPDVPLMLCFQKSPERIKASYDENGEMDRIEIQFDQPYEWALLEFPFGFEVFHPDEETSHWRKEAVSRCVRHHSMLLARPVACEEYYRILPEKQQVHIIQKFSYRRLDDSHHTKSLNVAPLPPPLALAAPEVPEITMDHRAISLDFPTKYGPLYGVPGSEWSEYILPLPPLRREFSIAPEKQKEHGMALEKDFQEYLDYHLNSKELRNPGNYQFLLQYAIPLLLFSELPETSRRKLEEILVDGLKKALNVNFTYTGPGGRRCFSWYRRTEPFSNVHYLMGYLHITGIANLPDCERDTVENTDLPFIEIDWGNAMSLYSIFLAALLTGQQKMIREKWDVIREVFDFYLVLMDWACMAAPSSENGVTWNDGTNYGAYPAFIQLAEMADRKEEYELGQYAFAKMSALRLGMMVSARTYFPRYFGVKPWFLTKCFHEERDLFSAFTNYPKAILHHSYREESLYNLTTEGHYPEAFQMYCRFLPEDVEHLLHAAEHAYQDHPVSALSPGVEKMYHSTHSALGEQEVFSWILLNLFSGRLSQKELAEMTEKASVNLRLSRELLGASFSYRRIPAEWTRCFLESQILGKHLPRITSWKHLRILRAAFPEIEIQSLHPDAWLEFTADIPFQIKSKHQRIEIKHEGAFLRICPNVVGKIKFTLELQTKNPLDIHHE